MPYAANHELPASVRNHLPDHAQDIFRAAFNNAWRSHSAEPDHEATCFRIAWAAVRRSYRKVGNNWEPREAGWGERTQTSGLLSNFSNGIGASRSSTKPLPVSET